MNFGVQNEKNYLGYKPPGMILSSNYHFFIAFCIEIQFPAESNSEHMKFGIGVLNVDEVKTDYSNFLRILFMKVSKFVSSGTSI